MKTTQITNIIIGIPAHNEEGSIRRLIDSILSQKQEDYRISEIVVIIDGSTDSTEHIVRSMRRRVVKVLNDGRRLGQSARIRQLMKHSRHTCDILVLLDADIELQNPYVIKRLIKPFEHKKVAMVAGRLMPSNTTSFVARSVATSVQTYERYVDSFDHGDTIRAVKGAMLALSSRLLRYSIPDDVYASDAYLYCLCHKKGYDFRLARTATAWYRIPETVADQVRQMSRFESSADNLEKYFGDYPAREYSRSLGRLRMYALLTLVSDPIHTIAIMIINSYARMWMKMHTHNSKSIWATVSSTKSVSI